MLTLKLVCGARERRPEGAPRRKMKQTGTRDAPERVSAAGQIGVYFICRGENQSVPFSLGGTNPLFAASIPCRLL